MDERDVARISALSNGSSIAIAILAKCLEATGALRPGQFELALRGTIDFPGAETDRLDYRYLAALLKVLEGPQPPSLRVIEGGIH